MTVTLIDELVTVTETWDHVFKDVAQASHTQDEQDALARIINGVSAAIQTYIGPVRNKTIADEKHDGGNSIILLDYSPVVSITALTENSMALTLGSDYYLYASQGIIKRASTTNWAGGWANPWGTTVWYGAAPQSIVVSYVAGRAATVETVPADIKTAALLWIHQLWSTGPANLSNLITESGVYLRPESMPAQVQFMLQPYRRPVVMAV